MRPASSARAARRSGSCDGGPAHEGRACGARLLGAQPCTQLRRAGRPGLALRPRRGAAGTLRAALLRRPHDDALWSLGVHDLSVILYLISEEPSEAVAHGNSFLYEGVEDVVFCYLRFPSGKIAHMHLSWLDPHKMRRITVVGKEKMVVFDDMEFERKVTIYEKAPEHAPTSYGEWLTRSGDIFSPKIANDEPLRLECEHFLALV